MKWLLFALCRRSLLVANLRYRYQEWRARRMGHSFARAYAAMFEQK
jgi:hypothetical protein